jgi:hypothetical protein
VRPVGAALTSNSTSIGSRGVDAGSHSIGDDAGGRVRRAHRGKPTAAAPALRAAARAALRDARAAAARCDPSDVARLAALCDAALRTLDAGAPPDAVRDVALCASTALARVAEAEARRDTAERDAEHLQQKLDAARAQAGSLRARAEGAASIAACVMRTAVTFMPRMTSRVEVRRPSRRQRRAEQRLGHDALMRLVNLPDLLVSGSVPASNDPVARPNTQARRQGAEPEPSTPNFPRRSRADLNAVRGQNSPSTPNDQEAPNSPTSTESVQRAFGVLLATEREREDLTPERDLPVTRLADRAAFFGQTLRHFYPSSPVNRDAARPADTNPPGHVSPSPPERSGLDAALRVRLPSGRDTSSVEQDASPE